jgi:hypothetical protein
MKDPAAIRRIATTLIFFAFICLLALQSPSGWNGEIRISSVRIVISLCSDTVRFRTIVSGNGQSVAGLAVGRDIA